MTDSTDLGGFAATYGVELLCESAPSLSKRGLFESFRRNGLNVKPLDGKLDNDLLAFLHPDHMVELADARIPAQTFIAASERPPSGELIELALQQSWSFGEARSVAARCTSSILVTDLMSSSLEYRERLALFQGVLQSVLEEIPCSAVHWTRTQQLIDPKRYLQTAREQPSQLIFCGGVNVRLFNIEGRNEHVMDTLGLAALGLPDLQCHFQGLVPNEVARMLYNTALYIFDNGDVIEDGHTVEGTEQGSKWRFQHEAAIVRPDRVVLDIDPGEPYAAGRS